MIKDVELNSADVDIDMLEPFSNSIDSGNLANLFMHWHDIVGQHTMLVKPTMFDLRYRRSYILCRDLRY